MVVPTPTWHALVHFSTVDFLPFELGNDRTLGGNSGAIGKVFRDN